MKTQSNTQSSSKGETASQHNHNALQQGSGKEMSSATAFDKINKNRHFTLAMGNNFAGKRLCSLSYTGAWVR
jgi:hypothetical protein